MIRTMRTMLCLATGLMAWSSVAWGDVPISGKPVPELEVFDDLMTNFMENNSIDAGLLGIMVDGEIVYQRGFGWADEDQGHLMRHDDVMRCASLTKPFTAAATQRLFLTTDLAPDDQVFDFGQEGGGVLNYLVPFGEHSLVAELMTVQHLISHASGFPTNDENDPMFREVEIADAFNDAGIETSYPPGIFRTTEWVLGQDLGLLGVPAYSNVGFMVLGQIVVEKAAMQHIEYVHQEVVGPIDWLPLAEVIDGRTHPNNRDPREPYYDTGMCQNVFDPNGPNVPCSDGGWDHEMHFAGGAFVVSTTALLHMAENYYINGTVDYGKPVTTRQPNTHTGRLAGTSALLQQRTDGINIAILFNKSDNPYATQMRDLIADAIDDGVQWPTQSIDGQWVDFADNGADEGSYEQPWQTVTEAKNVAYPEATLNFKPGSSDWTGTINKRLRLRAPEGTVTIGN